MQKVERVLSLAPKALFSPHLYDPSYQVDVQLDEPLWLPKAGPRQVAMDMMGLCVQLDSILMNSGPTHEEAMDPGRRVSFEKEYSSKVAAVLEQMKETLRRAGQVDDIETYLRESGIGYLFPRVEYFVQGEEQEMDKVPTPIMNGYFSHLSALHNVLTMSQQLNTDILSSPSHKYVAHQMALLYQCVGQVPQLAHYKKSIEGKFSAVKAACSTPAAGGHPPRLTPDLQRWLVDLTQRLIEQTSSLNPDLLSSGEQQTATAASCVQEVLSIVKNVPTQT